MPWTFAHPAFVLPLKRLGPLPLSLPALAVGSMMPDLFFYLGARPLSLYAHTLIGALLVGLPSGLVVLALCSLLRRPLIHLLPQPHRGALMARFGGPVNWRGPAIGSWVVSVLLGCWSHLLIDLFTHAPPAGAAWLQWLNRPLLTVDGAELLVHTAMQTGVSAAAVLVLVFAYRRWLRTLIALPSVTARLIPAKADAAGAGRPPVPFPMKDARPWRWWLHGALLVGAGLVGLGHVLLTAPPITSGRDLEFQVFRLLVMATMVYVPALLATAVAVWAMRPAAETRPA